MALQGTKLRKTLPQASHSYAFFLYEQTFVTRSCLKLQNPCSNHGIHVLFEHGFYLKKPKLGPDLHA